MTSSDIFGMLQGSGLLVGMLWAGRTESRLNAIDSVGVERDDKLHKRIDAIATAQTEAHKMHTEKLDKILQVLNAI